MRKDSFLAGGDNHPVLTTSARLLRLLSLLQSRRDWTGTELAGRLDVTSRTVRNDIEKLRSLGYPVDSRPGSSGGYRLGTGGALPALLLDSEEAVAIALGLRSAAGGTVAGLEEASLRAVTKLEQILPPRLRHQVVALAAAVTPAPGRGPTVDPDVLAAIADAAWKRERLRFDYTDHEGAVGRRDVEPHRLVSSGRRWYLAGWDADRSDWRTFRVDRISPRLPGGPSFQTREPPGGDFVDYVTQGVGTALWRHRARVRLHVPAAQVSGRLPSSAGSLEPVDAAHCIFSTGADTLPTLALYLGMLDVDFDVLEPPELRAHLARLGVRYTRAGAQ